MSSSIFIEGMPHSMVAPMLENGYAIEQDLVDPIFASALLSELKDNDMYKEGRARFGGNPGVFHNDRILRHLPYMPRLAEYRNRLNDAITDVSNFSFEHLTYLTVRVCPIREMSSRIHRNDRVAGPWLVSLTVAGSGSFNVYDNGIIEEQEEKELLGNETDPAPIASSDMSIGDAWGIFSQDWSAPHAGGLNTSRYPKVLVMLYGWNISEQYPNRRRF
jgi:hypothetical protein